MKPKNLLRAALLGFVVCSLAVLIYQEMRPTAPAPRGSIDPAATGPARSGGAKVVAYYFHGTARCPTCRGIERLSRETLEENFPAELQAGRLEFVAVNLDEPGQAHYARDFHLEFRTLVLARYRDGQLQRFERLDDVWTLAHAEPEFRQYVKAGVESLLGEAR